MALTIAGILLFIIANSFPFLSFEMQGQTTHTTLITGVIDLYLGGNWPVAAVVLFTSILAPGLQLMLLLIILVPLALERVPHWLPRLFRWVRTLAPWGMMDVFMLGILVAAVKLSAMATLVPGASLFAFAVLILVLAAAQAALDPDLVWLRVPLSRSDWIAPRPGEPAVSCDVCALVVRAPAAPPVRPRCPRCGDRLHARKPESLQRTWALLIAAIICYVPANLLPIMTVTSIGRSQSDTIMSGVVFMVHHDMWPLALVIFVASIFVPLLKLAILLLLLLSVQLRSSWRPRERTRLYRITEAIGRWSMVDVYVVTLLVALVRLGNLASVQPELGVVFFCAVVILTMLAAMSFDPRLIWDVLEHADVGERERAPAPNPSGSVRA